MGNISSDVSVDRLFRVQKEVILPGGTKVKVRVLSDMEVRDRDRVAFLARHNAQEKLKDTSSN